MDREIRIYVGMAERVLELGGKAYRQFGGYGDDGLDVGSGLMMDVWNTETL